MTVNSYLMRYSQAGKATVFGAVIRWFESSYRNYYLVATGASPNHFGHRRSANHSSTLRSYLADKHKVRSASMMIRAKWVQLPPRWYGRVIQMI